MKKRKILFRAGNLGGGGAEKVLITILENLNREKYEIDILLHQLSGVYIKDVPSDVGVYYLGKGEAYLGYSWLPKFIERKIEKKKYKWFKSNSKYIYSRVLNKKYDVEIAFLHDLMPLVAGSPTPKKIGWIHNDLAHKAYLTTQIKEDIVQSSFRFDKVVCVSTQALNSFIAMGGDEKHGLMIYNPIDREEILTKAHEKSITLDKSVVNLVAIGRLHAQKRYDRLMESIKILREKGLTNFHLTIMGQGELESELKAKCDNFKLNDFVTFLGFIENPYAILDQADVYVMSSDFEGFSLTVAESMILGKPIVSTKVTGPTELLQNGALGVLVEKDPIDLSDALYKMITDEAYRTAFSENLENAKLPFEKEQCMPLIEKLLLEI